MNAKTKELLWMLLWTYEDLARPSYRNLGESFESWAYRKGFLRHLQRLEKEELLESGKHVMGDRVYRLTEAGRLCALGGRDPVERWNRRWDGLWRTVLFDVPEAQKNSRYKLRRILANRGFGCLQRSVWITPDPLTEERHLWTEGPADVGLLMVLEGRPCAGESDAAIVARAWDFAEINRGYENHLQVLDRWPAQALDNPSAATAFHRWLQQEREAWFGAIAADPLLPKALLPEGYPGVLAWEKRTAIMAKVAAQIRCFHL